MTLLDRIGQIRGTITNGITRAARVDTYIYSHPSRLDVCPRQPSLPRHCPR